jgi:hypothetical protein
MPLGAAAMALVAVWLGRSNLCLAQEGRKYKLDLAKKMTFDETVLTFLNAVLVID